jgi:hypothetical protein
MIEPQKTEDRWQRTEDPSIRLGLSEDDSITKREIPPTPLLQRGALVVGPFGKGGKAMGVTCKKGKKTQGVAEGGMKAWALCARLRRVNHAGGG